MFLSAGDFWYQVNDVAGTADTLRAEWFPIGVKIGPVTAKYLIDYTKDTGARALRSIIEDFMLDIMYEIPKDSNIGSVTITEDVVEKKGAPVITMRA